MPEADFLQRPACHWPLARCLRCLHRDGYTLQASHKHGVIQALRCCGCHSTHWVDSSRGMRYQLYRHPCLMRQAKSQAGMCCPSDADMHPDLAELSGFCQGDMQYTTETAQWALDVHMKLAAIAISQIPCHGDIIITDKLSELGALQLDVSHCFKLQHVSWVKLRVECERTSKFACDRKRAAC